MGNGNGEMVASRTLIAGATLEKIAEFRTNGPELAEAFLGLAMIANLQNAEGKEMIIRFGPEGPIPATEVQLPSEGYHPELVLRVTKRTEESRKAEG